MEGNGPVAILANVHANLSYTQMKRWDLSQRNYIKINWTNCITEYRKHMGGVDSLDAHVIVCWIDVRGKKWYWPHYINTIDVLKSAAFKVFKLVNPDDKMDFLAFTRCITTHYLKASKLKKQLPPNIIYPRKRSWKGNAVIPGNERKLGQHFVEKCSQKRCRVCLSKIYKLNMKQCYQFVWNGKNTESKTRTVLKTSNGKIMLLSKCRMCD